MAQPNFDKAAFAALFFDIPGNQQRIFTMMAEVVRRASTGMVVRCSDDRQEFASDALLLALRLVNRADGKGYDPTKRTAYDYFYSVAKHHLCSLANEVRATPLGDFDASVTESSYEPQDPARECRKNSVNNWRSFRVHEGDSAEVARKKVEKYLTMLEARASRQSIANRRGDEGQPVEGSNAERVCLAILRVQVRQFRQAVLG